MYEAELIKIREKQEPHHNLTPGQWYRLGNIILFQHDLKPVEPGWCQLEEGEKRAAKALPVAQEFRMLQEVNNLKISVGLEPERRLDEGERERALKRLRSGKDIKLREGKEKQTGKAHGGPGTVLWNRLQPGGGRTQAGEGRRDRRTSHEERGRRGRRARRN